MSASLARLLLVLGEQRPQFDRPKLPGEIVELGQMNEAEGSHVDSGTRPPKASPVASCAVFVSVGPLGVRSKNPPRKADRC